MPDKSVKIQIEVVTAQAKAALNDVAVATKQTTGTLQAMEGASGSTTTSITNMGASLEKLGGSLRSIGSTLSIGLTAPLVAAGYAVVETSMKFQSSMELIRTQAGASQEEVDKMTKSVLALAASGETGQGPQKLADGLYHLESLGLRGAQAMDALKTSAQAADLGIADMEGVTTALGAAVVTGIKGTENMSTAMGLLDATIGQGNMRMQDLVGALSTGILPAAKNFGLTLQDVGAALATLTDNGMRADESATRLRMSFALMAAPTQKAKADFAAIGLSAYQLADDMRKPNGLVTAIQDLKDHLDASGMSATNQAALLSQAFGGGRSSAAILTLIQQVDRLKTKYDAIGQSADTFNEKVAATHETNYFQLQAALSQMQATLIDIGGTVMPIFASELSKVSGLIANLKTWWDGLNPSIKTFIVYLGEGAAVIGPVLVVVGTLASLLGKVTAAFNLASVAAKAFGTTLATVSGWGVIIGAAGTAAAMIQSSAADLIKSQTDLVTSQGDAAQSAVQIIKTSQTQIAAATKTHNQLLIDLAQAQHDKVVAIESNASKETIASLVARQHAAADAVNKDSDASRLWASIVTTNNKAVVTTNNAVVGSTEDIMKAAKDQAAAAAKAAKEQTAAENAANDVITNRAAAINQLQSDMKTLSDEYDKVSNKEKAFSFSTEADFTRFAELLKDTTTTQSVWFAAVSQGFDSLDSAVKNTESSITSLQSKLTDTSNQFSDFMKSTFSTGGDDFAKIVHDAETSLPDLRQKMIDANTATSDAQNKNAEIWKSSSSTPDQLASGRDAVQKAQDAAAAIQKQIDDKQAILTSSQQKQYTSNQEFNSELAFLRSQDGKNELDQAYAVMQQKITIKAKETMDAQQQIQDEIQAKQGELAKYKDAQDAMTVLYRSAVDARNAVAQQEINGLVGVTSSVNQAAAAYNNLAAAQTNASNIVSAPSTPKVTKPATPAFTPASIASPYFQTAAALPTVFSGFRANGGPVEAGSSYMVGEKGPELFSPRTSGTITPAGQSVPSPIVLNFNFHDAVVGDAGIKQVVSQAVGELNRQAVLRGFAGK